jgi:F-type H+-transporting ATPase subunit delta
VKNPVVSERYAHALFELAQENNVIDKIHDDLKVIKNVLNEYSDFNMLLLQPVVKKTDKKEMSDKIFKGNVSDITLNFLNLLIDKNREAFISEISEAYEKMVNKLHSKVVAKVYTAFEVDANELALLRRQLETYLGKTVDMETHVDATILGGVLVKIGDRVIDGTLKTRLNNMAKSLS